MSKKNNKPDCDWEEIERLYRADLRTNAQLARDFGIHATTITRRVKKYGWKRDLKNRIKERANALVQERAVKTLASDDQTIEENAQLTANVRLSHRADINAARSLSMLLLDDLKAQIGADNRARLEDLFIAALKANATDESALEAFERVTSVSSHIKSMKEWSEVATKLITLERQAYGLDDIDSSPVDALTTLLHSIANNNGNAFGVVKADPEYGDTPASNSIGVKADVDD